MFKQKLRFAREARSLTDVGSLWAWDTESKHGWPCSSGCRAGACIGTVATAKSFLEANIKALAARFKTGATLAQSRVK